MTEVLKNIHVGTVGLLKGDLTKKYTAVVLISDKTKTEELPKGTSLPVLYKYQVAKDAGWNKKIQSDISNFLLSRFDKTILDNKPILICSDDDLSRPVSAVVRLLIKLGFKKPDALSIIADKIKEPINEGAVKSFPDTDKDRVMDSAKAAHGPDNALTIMNTLMTGYGMAKKHIDLLPENVVAKAKGKE